MMTPTPEQAAAVRKIQDWYGLALDGLAPQVFRLFGPAGTGKTTLARTIIESLGVHARFMAYTGKAAHVLTRKGITASTIHSSIYHVREDDEVENKIDAALQELAEAKDGLSTMPGEAATIQERIDALEREIKELTSLPKKLTWEWNPEAMKDAPGLIVLDEVSMVNNRLAEDIERYRIPVLVLGDPAQLPPVEGGGYYINAPADVMLNEVHRQALDSPVLELATRVRTCEQPYSLGLTNTDTRPASLSEAMQADQVLVWSNKRRWAMIDAMRHRMGRAPGVPAVGDRIMCLSNNKDLAVFNGAQFTILEVHDATLGPTLRLLDDDDNEQVIPTFADGFQGLELEKQAKNSSAGVKGGRMLATFAQAITVHKAQGSEWDNVYVVNETPGMIAMAERREGKEEAYRQARRWLYTGITRASETVTVTAAKR